MSLSIKHSMESRRYRMGRGLAGLSVFSVSLVTVFGLACAKPESHAASSGSDSTVTSVATGETALAAGKSSDTVLTYCDKPNDSASVWAEANHHRSDPLAVSPQEYDGWKMFHVYCYRCHGTDAMGSDIAPNLRHSLGPEGGVNRACFITTVWNGRPPKGMPTWNQLLDSTQIRDLYAYVTARSMGGLVPGRPHIGTVSK